MENLTIGDEPAVRIRASYLTCTDKAVKYDCEGDHVWIPRSVHIQEPLKTTILVKEWWYNQNFD